MANPPIVARPLGFAEVRVLGRADVGAVSGNTREESAHRDGMDREGSGEEVWCPGLESNQHEVAPTRF